MGTFQPTKDNMKLCMKKRLLIMLNHESRELLQIMAGIKVMLDDHKEADPEGKQLSSTFDSTWEVIKLQISEVSNYLKGDEDVLLAYSEARAENPESTWVIQSPDYCKNDALPVGKK